MQVWHFKNAEKQLFLNTSWQLPLAAGGQIDFFSECIEIASIHRIL